MSLGSDHTGTGGPPDNDEAAANSKTSGSSSGRSKDISMAEVGGIVSRTLGLPADSPEVMQFATELHGTINRDPVLRHAVQNGGGIQSFILSQAPPDLVAKLDPAKRAELERLHKLQTANRTGSEFAAASGQSGFGAGGIGLGREARGNSDGSNRGNTAEAAVGKGSASAWEPSTGGAGLNPKNFGGTEFHAAGLNLGTTKEMFRQGFNQHEIVRAAKDAGSLGVPVNKDAPLIADLNKHAPQFMPKAHEVKSDADGIRAIAGSIAENEKRIAELRRKGDHQAAAALENQNKALTQQKEEKQKTYEQHKRDAVGCVPAAQKPKAQKVIEDIDHSLQQDLNKLGQGKKADIDAARKVVADYRQKPDDAGARGRYAALIDAGRNNAATRAAAASIDERLKKAEQLRDQKLASAATKEKANEGKAAEKADATKAGEEMFAALSAPATNKPAAKPEPEKAASKPEPGKSTAKAEPIKPPATKMAQAKPATLHA